MNWLSFFFLISRFVFYVCLFLIGNVIFISTLKGTRTGQVFKAPVKIQASMLYLAFSCVELVWEIFNNIFHSLYFMCRDYFNEMRYGPKISFTPVFHWSHCVYHLNLDLWINTLREAQLYKLANWSPLMPRLMFGTPCTVTVDKEAVEFLTGGKWKETFHIIP